MNSQDLRQYEKRGMVFTLPVTDTLVEQIAQNRNCGGLEAREYIHQRVRRAMDHELQTIQQEADHEGAC